jgi:hypothetical protein
MLPELQACAWQAALDGALQVTAIKGVRGTRRRSLLPAELLRLTPDWHLSRLVHGSHDEFIDVRVRRAPAEPVKATWRSDKPAQEDVNAAMVTIAQGYPPPEQYGKDTPRPALVVIWGKVKELCGDATTRKQVQDALAACAPHLQGQRGYSSGS